MLTGPGEPTESAPERVAGDATFRPLRGWFLLDVLQDRDSRPVLFWAFGTLLFGMLAYHRLEGWGYIDALYFCVVSLATVGYGDLTPTTPFAKLFTVIYLINGIGILLTLFDRIRVVRGRRFNARAARRRDGLPDPTGQDRPPILGGR